MSEKTMNPPSVWEPCSQRAFILLRRCQFGLFSAPKFAGFLVFLHSQQMKPETSCCDSPASQHGTK